MVDGLIAACPHCSSTDLVEDFASSTEPHGEHFDQVFYRCGNCASAFDIEDAAALPERIAPAAEPASAAGAWRVA